MKAGVRGSGGRTGARSARYGGPDNGPGNGRGRNASPRSAGIANFGRGYSRETSGIMYVFFSVLLSLARYGLFFIYVEATSDEL